MQLFFFCRAKDKRFSVALRRFWHIYSVALKKVNLKNKFRKLFKWKKSKANYDCLSNKLHFHLKNKVLLAFIHRNKFEGKKITKKLLKGTKNEVTKHIIISSLYYNIFNRNDIFASNSQNTIIANNIFFEARKKAYNDWERIDIWLTFRLHRRFWIKKNCDVF